MPYSEFTLSEAVRRFALTLHEARDLFGNVAERAPSDQLAAILAENAPLALAMRTEKARSELIIAPILLEVRRASGGRVSLFSGADFNIDPAEGLNGACDFLMTRSPHQLYIESPVLAIVEAKREDVVAGMGQCAAAMIAAQRFNERDGRPLPVIYGAVTTGDIWKFLTLESNALSIDQTTYYLDRISAILGVLTSIVEGEGRD
jgi:hypothetical protein